MSSVNSGKVLKTSLTYMIDQHWQESDLTLFIELSSCCLKKIKEFSKWGLKNTPQLFIFSGTLALAFMFRPNLNPISRQAYFVPFHTVATSLPLQNIKTRKRCLVTVESMHQDFSKLKETMTELKRLALKADMLAELNPNSSQKQLLKEVVVLINHNIMVIDGYLNKKQ